jgi:putative (di)nucleoside polyphosphate hydrolase
VPNREDGYFRAGVGAVIANGAGKILAMRRKGVADAAWQMPQGGIGFTETPTVAVWREINEETGLTPGDLQLVHQLSEWTVYELPREFRSDKVGWGQAQRWFLLRASPTAAVTPDGKEFDAFNWLAPADLVAQAVAFRVPVYERVFREFAQWLRSPT